jgi:regulator of nucleoside diphosphate kinase
MLAFPFCKRLARQLRSRQLPFASIGFSKSLISPPQGVSTMLRRKIIMTAVDHRRLNELLASETARVVGPSAWLAGLKTELDRAETVSPDDVPANVVTMDSTVMLRDVDTDEVEVYTLVYPDRADIANNQLSVLAPVGTAILGYQIGDEVRWRVPAGWRRLRIEQILYQPERAGASSVVSDGGVIYWPSRATAEARLDRTVMIQTHDHTY